jgi:hypothetical protein
VASYPYTYKQASDHPHNLFGSHPAGVLQYFLQSLHARLKCRNSLLAFFRPIAHGTFQLQSRADWSPAVLNIPAVT